MYIEPKASVLEKIFTTFGIACLAIFAFFVSIFVVAILVFFSIHFVKAVVQHPVMFSIVIVVFSIIIFCVFSLAQLTLLIDLCWKCNNWNDVKRKISENSFIKLRYNEPWELD